MRRAFYLISIFRLKKLVVETSVFFLLQLQFFKLIISFCLRSSFEHIEKVFSYVEMENAVRLYKIQKKHHILMHCKMPDHIHAKNTFDETFIVGQYNEVRFERPL